MANVLNCTNENTVLTYINVLKLMQNAQIVQAKIQFSCAQIVIVYRIHEYSCDFITENLCKVYLQKYNRVHVWQLSDISMP